MAVRLTIRLPSGEEAGRLDFDQARIRVGRGGSCDVRLPAPTVSAAHAMIAMDRDRYYVVDLGSTNGTTLNDEPLVVDRRKLLRSGDIICVAGFSLEFQAGVAMLSPHSQDRTVAAARQLARFFMAASESELPGAALVVLAGPQEGERFELPPAPATLTLGRSEECDIVLVDSEISRKAAELVVGEDGLLMRDLGGKNPIRIGGRDVEHAKVHDRDEVQVGSTVLVLDEPVEAFLRDMAERVEDERREEPAPPPAVEDGPEAEAGADEPSSGGPGRGSAQASLAPEPPVPGARSARGSPGGEEDPSPPSEPKRSLVPSSAGSEMAVLFVGALALAACVAALVWLFR